VSTCSTLWSKLKHKATSSWQSNPFKDTIPRERISRYLSRTRPSTRRMLFWRCSRRLDNCYVLF
ncbi:hypothetical protein JG688_00003844, partial [Phytophthora aleatoria]